MSEQETPNLPPQFKSVFQYRTVRQALLILATAIVSVLGGNADRVLTVARGTPSSLSAVSLQAVAAAQAAESNNERAVKFAADLASVKDDVDEFRGDILQLNNTMQKVLTEISNLRSDLLQIAISRQSSSAEQNTITPVTLSEWFYPGLAEAANAQEMVE